MVAHTDVKMVCVCCNTVIEDVIDVTCDDCKDADCEDCK